MKNLAIALMAITISSPVLAASKLPFVGTKYFNFDGGVATEQSITINKKGQATIKYYGSAGTFVDYRGKYQNPIPLKQDDGSRYYYKIVGNTILMLDENKNLEYGCSPFSQPNYEEAGFKNIDIDNGPCITELD